MDIGMRWSLVGRRWACFMAALSVLNCDVERGVSAHPNVLMIVVDDLNDWVGCLGGHSQAQTPNIDQLAASGTVFTNAHCQAPLCNPSRCSVLSGLRPSTTGIYALAPGLRQVRPMQQHVTLPQEFRRAGYFTFGCGKIYHDGSLTHDDMRREFDRFEPGPPMPLPPQKLVPALPGHRLMDWGALCEPAEKFSDWQIATAAIAALREAPQDRPFFIACGFRLPHVPCYAPRKWFDLYPMESLELPPIREDDRCDTPRFSWYLHWKLPEPRLAFLREHGEWTSLVQSYLASISFMDHQIGRVLKALHASGSGDNTIVVLWSDHGYHLGEKHISGKNSLWEPATRVPLIFSGPSITRGARCSQPVELLDVFPTLIELNKLPPRGDLQGHSLAPQLRNANLARPWPAITTHNENNHSIRSRHWRYIRYANDAEELYDLRRDPHEWFNLADDEKYLTRKREMARWLPKSNARPVSGSADRFLTYSEHTGVVEWEGEPIEQDAPIPGIGDFASELGNGRPDALPR